jgi:hypothetical protein
LKVSLINRKAAMRFSRTLFIISVIFSFVITAESSANKIKDFSSKAVRMAKVQYDGAEAVYFTGSHIHFIKHCGGSRSESKRRIKAAIEIQKEYIMLATLNRVGDSWKQDRGLYNSYMKVFNKGLAYGEMAVDLAGTGFKNDLRSGYYCNEMAPELLVKPKYYENW